MYLFTMFIIIIKSISIFPFNKSISIFPFLFNLSIFYSPIPSSSIYLSSVYHIWSRIPSSFDSSILPFFWALLFLSFGLPFLSSSSSSLFRVYLLSYDQIVCLDLRSVSTDRPVDKSSFFTVYINMGSCIS